LIDNNSDMFDLSLFQTNKRQRIRCDSSSLSCDDISQCSDATPATNALERSLTEANAVVDQLEMTLSMSGWLW
jgi:hypothetical protein